MSGARLLRSMLIPYLIRLCHLQPQPLFQPSHRPRSPHPAAQCRWSSHTHRTRRPRTIATTSRCPALRCAVSRIRSSMRRSNRRSARRRARPVARWRRTCWRRHATASIVSGAAARRRMCKRLANRRLWD